MTLLPGRGGRMREPSGPVMLAMAAVGVGMVVFLGVAVFNQRIEIGRSRGFPFSVDLALVEQPVQFWLMLVVLSSLAVYCIVFALREAIALFTEDNT